MSSAPLSAARAETFLAACFAVAREAVATPTCFEPAARALEAAFNEQPRLAAPTLALDLHALLTGERLLPVSARLPEPVRDALRAYEDAVLARLTGDRRWTRLCDAVAATRRDLRPAAVGLVAAHLFGRLGLTSGPALSQAVVRRFPPRLPADAVAQGRDALFDADLAALVAEGLLALARAARRTRELLTDADLFLVENVAQLKSLSARVALAQLAEVAQAIEEALPPRRKGRVAEDGDVPTAMEVEAAYPVGGFSALTTSGSLENLVSSELIYMDEAAARPDLFDVRFVEGELLYYARDESVAIRRRRSVCLVLDASLVAARVLDPGERYQRLVWLLGALTALVRRLSQWLDTEALRFELVFIRGPQEAPLAEEAGVLSLVLRDYRARGQVGVAEGESVAQVVAAAHTEGGAGSRTFVFGTRFPAGLDGAARPDAFVDLSDGAPRALWLDGGRREGGPAADGLSRWAGLTRELVEGVLRRARPQAPRAGAGSAA